MVQNSVSYFPSKIQAFTVFFEDLDYTDALLIMCEAARMDFIQCPFTGMSERCMSQIMTKRNCLNQIARTIAKALRLNEDLVEAIALGHDLPVVLEKPASYLSSAGMPYNAVSGHGLSDKPYVHHTLPLSAPCPVNGRYVQHRD